MLEIEYEPDELEETLGLNIKSVRVLDGTYVATGPNILALLDQLFILKSATEGEPFLNRVATELAA